MDGTATTDEHYDTTDGTATDGSTLRHHDTTDGTATADEQHRATDEKATNGTATTDEHYDTTDGTATMDCGMGLARDGVFWFVGELAMLVVAFTSPCERCRL